MSTITVSLADEDLAFLRRFSEAQGTSAEEFLARQAQRLRVQFERPSPDGRGAVQYVDAREAATASARIFEENAELFKKLAQ